MKYESEELDVSFEIPDKPTVRQQLAYKAALATGGDWISRGWAGFLAIMQDWQCAKVPDVLALDMDKETDPDIADIVIFVSGKTINHMSELERVPKNS